MNTICFNGNQIREILTTIADAEINGMALDWKSDLLYFIDAHRKTIEIINILPTDSLTENNMHRTVIRTGSDSKPSSIAIDLLNGYVYWADQRTQQPSIRRANLNRFNTEVLIKKPDLLLPNAIAIDPEYVLYWIDAHREGISYYSQIFETCVDIMKNDSRIQHPFSIASDRHNIYWDDAKYGAIFKAELSRSMWSVKVNCIWTLLEHLDIVDMKAKINVSSSGYPCTSGNHTCSHYRIRNSVDIHHFDCVCSNTWITSDNDVTKCVCPGSRLPLVNGTCPTFTGLCLTKSRLSPSFECFNGNCISIIGVLQRY